MKQTDNINLPILEQGDKYLKETQNEAFKTIDTEIKGLSDAVKVLDNVEGSIIDVSKDVNTLKEQYNNIANEVIPNVTEQLEDMKNDFDKTQTVIKSIDNLQFEIDRATTKVIFVKGDYELTNPIKLKGGITYDFGNSTINLIGAGCFEIENGVGDIVIENLNLFGDLKHSVVTELLNGGKKIKCKDNIFKVGDKLGGSNYGVIDNPYATITSYENGYYNLDVSLSTTGTLLNNDFGAVIGTFQWSAMINGKHDTNNITINNCHFENARGYAFAIPNSDDITIKNTSIKNNGLDFCIFSAENKDRFNLLIDNCKFENNIDFGKQGIVITKIEGIYYKNIKIVNSVFSNITESGVSLGYAEGNLQNVIISKNEFYNNILFSIHCCGNNIDISDNTIVGSEAGIRIADIESETYRNDTLYDDINISNNKIYNGSNGIIASSIKKESGGYFIPKNITIDNNTINCKFLAIEVSGHNINIKDNRTSSSSNTGNPFYVSSVFISGSDNKNINIKDNFFDGEVNIGWINAFNVKIENNTINGLRGDKPIRIKPLINSSKNMNCVVKNNSLYKTNSINLSTSDGRDGVEFVDNKLINGDLITTIPYMCKVGAYYDGSGDGIHWISNIDSSHLYTKDNYFKSNGKFGYISSDGTFKITDSITNAQ